MFVELDYGVELQCVEVPPLSFGIRSDILLGPGAPLVRFRLVQYREPGFQTAEQLVETVEIEIVARHELDFELEHVDSELITIVRANLQFLNCSYQVQVEGFEGSHGLLRAEVHFEKEALAPRIAPG